MNDRLTGWPLISAWALISIASISVWAAVCWALVEVLG